MFLNNLKTELKNLSRPLEQHEEIEGAQIHREKQREIQQESSRSLSMVAIPGFGYREKILAQVVVAQREDWL